MAKVFFIRHQAGGVMHEFPFAAEPTADQQAAVYKVCRQRFGVSHAKTPDEPYWARVVEVELLDGDTVPEVPEQGKDTANVAGLGPIAVIGRGTVTPKAG